MVKWRNGILTIFYCWMNRCSVVERLERRIKWCPRHETHHGIMAIKMPYSLWPTYGMKWCGVKFLWDCTSSTNKYYYKKMTFAKCSTWGTVTIHIPTMVGWCKWRNAPLSNVLLLGNDIREHARHGVEGVGHNTFIQEISNKAGRIFF